MDLRTKYIGLELKNPIVAAASPLSESLEGIQRLAEAGAGAVVMFSLFEEQLKAEEAAEQAALSAGTESFAEAVTYFPRVGDYRVGPDQYLDLIRRASQAVDIPILGSLNAVSSEGWIDYARKIEEAGAKGLELNIYGIVTNPKLSAAKVEKKYVEIVKAVRAAVAIPLAVKLSPFFSSIPNLARKLKNAGARGLVLFNRFYQPDVDPETMSVAPTLELSRPEEMRLALRWIAILHGRVKVSLAASTGVHTGLDVAKYLLAGADVVMTASGLIQKGPGHVATLLRELQEWMERKEYRSVRQIKGMLGQKSVADPAAFERANYIRILEKYKSGYHLPAEERRPPQDKTGEERP